MKNLFEGKSLSKREAAESADADQSRVKRPKKKKKAPVSPEAQAPAYVATIPVVVDPGSDGESSCDESNPDEFTDEYYQKPTAYFRLANKRGGVPPEEIEGSPGQSLPVRLLTPQVAQLVNTFRDEVFGKNADESWPEYDKRFGLSLLLNRMRSLSSRKNKKMEEARVGYCREKNVGVAKVYWEGRWEEKKGGKWVSVEYERVRCLYKKLKYKDLESAEKFRHSVEETIRPKNANSRKKDANLKVPYRELREAIKGHQTTRWLVRHFRDQNAARPMYMGVLDSDVVTLRPSKRGCFSHYDDMIAEHLEKHSRALEIASGGYMIPDDNPVLALAVLLDLWVRHATASVIPNGVMYPEPNTIIRILLGRDTVEGSFLTKDKHYESPQEMPVLMASIIEGRGLGKELNSVLRFNAAAAIATKAPSRMLRVFTAHMSSKEEVVRWSQGELQKMRGVSQSHFHTFKWAKFVLSSYAIPSEVSLSIADGGVITLKNRNFIEKLAVSAVSRLYRHYDAISIASGRLGEGGDLRGFQKCLIGVFESYTPVILSGAHVRGSSEDRGHTKDATYRQAQQYLDQITDMAEIKSWINQLLDGEHAGAIEQAAVQAGRQAVKILQLRLCLDFPELSRYLVRDYFAALLGDNTLELPSEACDVVYRDILENNFTTTKDGSAERVVMNRPFLGALRVSEHSDPWGCHPLHWAAATGNHLLVRGLLGHARVPGWVKNIRVSAAGPREGADCKVLPLHLALQYCMDNGSDVELVKCLSDEVTVRAQASDGRSPFLMAVQEVSACRPILEDFVLKGAMPEELGKSFLEKVFDVTQFEERRCVLLPIIYRMGRGGERMRLVKHLVKHHGCDVNEEGPLFERIHYVDKDDDGFIDYDRIDRDDYTRPIFEAIMSGDIELVKYLASKGAKVKGVYDFEGKPPAICALCLDDPVEMIECLMSLGVDLDEGVDGAEETLLLHELVRPHFLNIIDFDVEKRKKILQQLLSKDVLNLNVRNEDEQTALQMLLDEAIEHDAGDEDGIIAMLWEIYEVRALDGECMEDLTCGQTALLREITGRNDIRNEEDVERKRKTFEADQARHLGHLGDVEVGLVAEACRELVEGFYGTGYVLFGGSASSSSSSEDEDADDEMDEDDNGFDI